MSNPVGFKKPGVGYLKKTILSEWMIQINNRAFARQLFRLLSYRFEIFT
ncbi:hypothetical protein SAMN04488057_12250 [Cyclobacterium lianum]|uniref:Uncharacterized protein n=1 Tax=Cyclobacterium lianum TaxID=388280 RepID=A0A1M7QRU2_9BACT|nr:hypothetical protein SAMN04488057_12250 [Cyclobacterium lianum]